MDHRLICHRKGKSVSSMGMKPAQATPDNAAKQPWWRMEDKAPAASCERMLLPGDSCPHCGEAALAYNGLFQLECRECKKIAEPGAFT